jgi:hypothetical protein
LVDTSRSLSSCWTNRRGGGRFSWPARREDTIDAGITRDPPHPDHGGPTDSPVYLIRVKGHLGARWERWFDGLTITREPDGITLLAGPVIDQSALHGILTRIRDLGLPLISVTQAGAAGNHPIEESTT